MTIRHPVRHLAAAALLLAAAPAFADDLLDAVLWDGPSAFPSTAEPAPVPPPPPAPELPPPPAPPAPSYPSRSSYAPRSPSLPPPAAPEPSATATVPATAAPASLSGEARIRREIQEMRDRADRLEAALGPAEPPKPARPQYDRADWPERARLSIRAAVVAEDFTVHKNGKGIGTGGGEFAFPLAGTSFDIAVQGTFSRYENDKRNYISSGHVSIDSPEKSIFELIGWGIWTPFRGAVLSPHAGLGIGYGRTTGHRTLSEGRWHNGWWGGGYWDYDKIEEKSLDDNNFILAGRVGATLTYKRFTLKGEFILTSETKTLLAEAGLRIWEHLVLNALVERMDLDISESPTAFGGGVTILF